MRSQQRHHEPPRLRQDPRGVEQQFKKILPVRDAIVANVQGPIQKIMMAFTQSKLVLALECYRLMPH